MPLRGLLLALGCVALLAVGQLLFKSAAQQWRVEGWSLATVSSLVSAPLVAAVALYALATVLWVLTLRMVPLTTAYPLYALTFVIVPVLAHYFADEPLSPRSMIGAAVIVAGVLISVK